MDDADSLGSFTGVSRPGSDYCQRYLFGVEQGGDVAELDAGEFECGFYLRAVVHEVPQAIAQLGQVVDGLAE